MMDYYRIVMGRGTLFIMLLLGCWTVAHAELKLRPVDVTNGVQLALDGGDPLTGPESYDDPANGWGNGVWHVAAVPRGATVSVTAVFTCVDAPWSGQIRFTAGNRLATGRRPSTAWSLHLSQVLFCS